MSEVDNVPYIVCLDSYGVGYFQENFGLEQSDQLVIVGQKQVASDLAVDAAARAMFDQSKKQFAKDLEVSEIFQNVQPAIDEINRRGYAPEAVISCPFFANALLVQAVEYEEPDCPPMKGFSGEVSLLLSQDIERYQDELPDLFAQHNIVGSIQFSKFTESSQLVKTALERVGIEIPAKLEESTQLSSPTLRAALGNGKGIDSKAI